MAPCCDDTSIGADIFDEVPDNNTLVEVSDKYDQDKTTTASFPQRVLNNRQTTLWSLRTLAALKLESNPDDASCSINFIM